MFRVLVLSAAVMFGAGSRSVAQECRVETRVSTCVAGFCKYDAFAGNGVYVGRNDDNSASIVVTAAHVLDGRNRNAKVERVTVDDTPARILGRWYEEGGTDLAILRVAGPADRLAVHALTMPPNGAEITMTGIIDGSRRVVSGILTDAERRRGRYGGGSGWSGSGVYNSDGELLGVHNRKTTEQAGEWYRAFTSIRRLDQFVASMAPDCRTGRELAENGVAIAAATPAPTTRQGTRAGTPGNAGGQWKPSKADNGDDAQDASADSPGSLVDKGKKIVGAAADVAKDVVGGTAEGVGDSIGPGAIGAFSKGGWPYLAAYVGGHAAYAIWRRRRNRSQTSGDAPTPETPSDEPIVDSGANAEPERPISRPETPPTAVPVEIPGLDDIKQQIAALSERIVGPDALDERTNAIIEALKGISTGSVVGDDGKTVDDTLWKAAVRKLSQGSPELNIVGGPEAGKAAERWVYQQLAKAAGSSL